MHAPLLRTESLELTPPNLDDVDAIFVACQDPGIQQYTPVPSPYQRTDAVAFVEKVTGWWEDGLNPTWALREAGRLVGTVGLYRADGQGAAELGYWVAPDARNRGFAVEASRAVVDWGFSPEGLDLVRIEWRATAGNIGSARAARTLGFRYEGLLRSSLTNGRGERSDGWIAGLLRDDDRTPHPWSVLED